MKVTIINESGYKEALLGLSLSYNPNQYDDTPFFEQNKELPIKLAFKGDGHNKFLESIIVWIDVIAPRYWHCQCDTYRLATKQSGSTMHSIAKRQLRHDDFEGGIQCLSLLDQLNMHIKAKDWIWVKRHLPESFLQRRVMCTSYMTLQRMIRQRTNHKLPEWKVFIDSILEQAEHPELLKRAGAHCQNK